MVQQNSDSVYSVFHVLARFHYYRMHMLFEKVGIYPGQHALLFILGKQSGLRQRELAERLHIKAATTTVMLNRMAKAGLVERRPDPNDQRIARVYLTNQGRAILTQVKESLKIIEAECFYNFTPEEQNSLLQLLVKMRDNLIQACAKNSDE